MLILTRYTQESIIIGDDVEVVVLDVNRITGSVRLGINAPKDVDVFRKEILPNRLSANIKTHNCRKTLKCK